MRRRHRSLVDLLTFLSGLIFVAATALWIWTAADERAYFVGSHRVAPAATAGGRVTVVWSGVCLCGGRIVFGRSVALRTVAWYERTTGRPLSTVNDFGWFSGEQHLIDGDEDPPFPVPFMFVRKAYETPPANARAELRQGRMPVFGYDGFLSDTTVYDWFILLVAAALPAGRGWRALDRYVVRRNRRMAMCCANCGYDLRASPARCPECGTVPTAQAARPGGAGG